MPPPPGPGSLPPAAALLRPRGQRRFPLGHPGLPPPPEPDGPGLDDADRPLPRPRRGRERAAPPRKRGGQRLPPGRKAGALLQRRLLLRRQKADPAAPA